MQMIKTKTKKIGEIKYQPTTKQKRVEEESE